MPLPFALPEGKDSGGGKPPPYGEAIGWFRFGGGDTGAEGGSMGRWGQRPLRGWVHFVGAGVLRKAACRRSPAHCTA